jgi:hypothetical protein
MVWAIGFGFQEVQAKPCTSLVWCHQACGILIGGADEAGIWQAWKSGGITSRGGLVAGFAHGDHDVTSKIRSMPKRKEKKRKKASPSFKGWQVTASGSDDALFD